MKSSTLTKRVDVSRADLGVVVLLGRRVTSGWSHHHAGTKPELARPETEVPVELVVEHLEGDDHGLLDLSDDLTGFGVLLLASEVRSVDATRAARGRHRVGKRDELAAIETDVAHWNLLCLAECQT